jgi:hypothetical protein
MLCHAIRAFQHGKKLGKENDLFDAAPSMFAISLSNARSIPR